MLAGLTPCINPIGHYDVMMQLGDACKHAYDTNKKRNIVILVL